MANIEVWILILFLGNYECLHAYTQVQPFSLKDIQKMCKEEHPTQQIIMYVILILNASAYHYVCDLGF